MEVSLLWDDVALWNDLDYAWILQSWSKSVLTNVTGIRSIQISDGANRSIDLYPRQSFHLILQMNFIDRDAFDFFRRRQRLGRSRVLRNNPVKRLSKPLTRSRYSFTTSSREAFTLRCPAVYNLQCETVNDTRVWDSVAGRISHYCCWISFEGWPRAIITIVGKFNSRPRFLTHSTYYYNLL